MAKKNLDTSDFINKILQQSEKVDKELTKFSSRLSDSVYGNIDEYIDTGSYALNRLITGSLYKGIPRGRVCGFAGLSGTFKSALCGQIIANAQKMGYTIMFYDSESAIDNDFLARLGGDTSKIIRYSIDGIEQFRNHVINTYKPLLEENPDEKILIVLDSYANLSSAKEMSDVESGKENSDMGCFVPDTKILTKNGVKFIQNIEKGDEVLTHLNRYKTVINLFKYNNKLSKIKINTCLGIIEVTPEHKLLVFCNDKKRLMWKEAKYITKQDKLVKQK